MAGIPVSEETIKQFQENDFSSSGPEGSEAEGVDPTAQLNEVANWLLKTADTALASYTESAGGTPEEVEKVKWDEESRKRTSELSVLVAKRNISNDILRNSPELFLGSIVAGKIIEVGIVISAINKRQVNQGQESEKEQDNE